MHAAIRYAQLSGLLAAAIVCAACEGSDDDGCVSPEVEPGVATITAVESVDGVTMVTFDFEPDDEGGAPRNGVTNAYDSPCLMSEQSVAVGDTLAAEWRFECSVDYVIVALETCRAR